MTAIRHDPEMNRAGIFAERPAGALPLGSSLAHALRPQRYLCLFLCLFLLPNPLDAQAKRFSFGAIADIQWANKQASDHRDYAGSLGRLDSCARMMNAEKPSFVIQCGDLVDGWADDPVRTAADIDSVLEVVGRFTSPAYHVAGNHCYRAGAATLRRKYHLRSLYYDFRLPDVAGWRFIALDGNDAGYGLLGRAQLRWLGARLADALRRKERVIVFCHFPAVTEALPDERRGNADTLLSILEKSGVVRMYISGHEHAGGYALSRGIHHLTLKAMVDQSVRPTFAVMDVYDDQIIERGFGSEPDRILPIDPLPPAPKKARSRH